MLVDHNPRKTSAPLPAGRSDPDALRRVDSATLLGPGGEVLIVHQQQVYRLRVTSLGKLILTK
ncbi:hemin uptake protein HemP [Roseateles asaccharophilus]|uniref:Hemin uptake protein HemP n=1 Tax=Roseateles asaccharophilus TaxID=582607 RepID=A0ABU2A2U2_9BURK|nr:hemin uptake protein HemP [Roseateles asaccharophilus]MDR7331507.1 hemin uptake protein HemP [Roseateles asaccharophilus]